MSGRQTLRIFTVASVVVIVAMLVALYFVLENTPSTFKSYDQGDFWFAVRGKTEAEIIALLGHPELNEIESANGSQAGKRCFGYATTGRESWGVKGEAGGVLVYFNSTSGRVDHIHYVPAPQRQNGIFIFVRF